MKIHVRKMMCGLLVGFVSNSAFGLSVCEKMHEGPLGVGYARVAISGSHTDYNFGWTLAGLLPVKTMAVVLPRKDGEIRVKSGDQEFHYKLGQEAVTGEWGDYIRGITTVLRQDGIRLEGADINISSDIPMGAGISSSAALVTAIIKGLREAYDLKIDDLQIAKMGQRVEHFVGAKTGLLDQMTISLLDRDTDSALFIDFSTMKYKKVQLPKDAEFVIVHSGLTHSLKDVHGDRNYATRRAESEKAAQILEKENLSQMSLQEFKQISGKQKEALGPKLYKRALHVISENDRVTRFIQASAVGNLKEMGRIMSESHNSQRDNYDISEAPIDVLVQLLQKQPGVLGAQLTGGGFGGAVVFLAQKGQGVEIAQKILELYSKHPINQGQYKPRIIAPLQNNP